MWEMRIITLSLIASCIFASMIVFIIIIHLIHLGFWLDYNPHHTLPYLEFNSAIVAVPIILGTVSLVFLVPNIILKIKKIPTKRYMLAIAAGILIFFGLPYIRSGMESIISVRHLADENDLIRLIAGLISIGMGMIYMIPGIIALKKIKLTIKEFRQFLQFKKITR